MKWFEDCLNFIRTVVLNSSKISTLSRDLNRKFPFTSFVYPCIVKPASSRISMPTINQTLFRFPTKPPRKIIRLSSTFFLQPGDKGHKFFLHLWSITIYQMKPISTSEFFPESGRRSKGKGNEGMEMTQKMINCCRLTNSPAGERLNLAEEEKKASTSSCSTFLF